MWKKSLFVLIIVVLCALISNTTFAKSNESVSVQDAKMAISNFINENPNLDNLKDVNAKLDSTVFHK